MCGCLILGIGFIAPRFALILVALFTHHQISRAFDGGLLVPFLGWLLLPYSTLTYVCLHWWTGSVGGFKWLFVVFAFIADLGSYGVGYTRRDRLTLRA